ncbi:hypothetical protein [Bradyrhizobium sp. Bra64]|uniref:hypothetical protein n=1 Tax=Bradyrhizobium sp. Bra64 TaxID=2926009 RepID=UPI0021199524|nr:hypothetical protein [Bradyrhizobium sp. Bra64]
MLQRQGELRQEAQSGYRLSPMRQKDAANLHRSDLTALERDEQIARWVELLSAKGVSDKLSETKREGRPGAAASVARITGVNERNLQRAVKVASLSDEAKEAAKEVGLDNNRSALLDAAAKPTVAEQVAAIHQRHTQLHFPFSASVGA